MKKLHNFSAPVFSAECCDVLVYMVLRMRKLQLEKSQEEVLDQVYELKEKSV